GQCAGQGAAGAGPVDRGRWGGLPECLAYPQPGDLPGRPDLAELEADRWSVPEPFSAAAGILRARGEAAPRRVPGGHQTGFAARPAERGAAALVLGWRAAGDRFQPGVRPGRAGEHRLRRGRAQADLAAAPGTAGTGR